MGATFERGVVRDSAVRLRRGPRPGNEALAKFGGNELR